MCGRRAGTPLNVTSRLGLLAQAWTAGPRDPGGSAGAEAVGGAAGPAHGGGGGWWLALCVRER